MNSSMSFQPHFTARKNKRCLEEENQILRQKLNEYIEMENDRLKEIIEILNNKLQESNSKYDDINSKYSILQKENEELKNKSKNEVIVPEQPVPPLGSNEQLEEEAYIQDNSTDEQLLNALISTATNQPERNRGTGKPANHCPYNEEENNYLKTICIELGEKEKQARENYDEAYKKLIKSDKDNASSEYKNLKKERTETHKKFDKARKEFNGKNIIVLFKSKFTYAKRRQDIHLQQKVTRVKGELRKEGKISKNIKPFYDTAEAKAFRKSQKEEIETY